MHGLVYTKHFALRYKQRGLNKTVVDALLHYVERKSTRRGIDSLVFTKRALAEIRSDHGKEVFLQCERQRKAYIIISEDAVAITVAHSYRGTVH